MGSSFLEGLRISVFTVIADSCTVWKEMEGRAAASIYPFQRYAWMSVWLATIGKARGVEPHIILVADEETGAACLLPLCIRISRTIKVLEWMGSGVSDYTGPLSVKGTGGAELGFEAIDAVIRKTGREAACDAVDLDRMPGKLSDGSENHFITGGLSSKQGRRACFSVERLHYSAHALKLPTHLDVYLKERFSSKERYNLKRSEKQLEALGTLDFIVARTEPEREWLTRVMVEQKRVRYRATGAEDNFSSPENELFYATAAMGDELGVELSALILDGKPIATHWGVRDPSTMYFLMPTFDAGYERHSPGKVFLLRLIEYCIREKLSCLDFTIGDEEYKQKFCTDEMPLFVYLRGFSILGCIYVASRKVLAYLKKGPLLDFGRRIKRASRKFPHLSITISL